MQNMYVTACTARALQAAWPAAANHSPSVWLYRSERMKHSDPHACLRHLQLPSWQQLILHRLNTQEQPYHMLFCTGALPVALSPVYACSSSRVLVHSALYVQTLRYTDWPTKPRIYCDPQPDGTADWNRNDIKGDCVAFCPRLPYGLGIQGVTWPSNCTDGLIEGASNKPWSPQSTCYGRCQAG